MTVIVTTPTGRVGSRVVQLLVQSGVRPRVLLRDPGRLDASIARHVEAVRVDLGDSDAVLRATEGAEALFWVNPPSGDDDPVAGYARMGANAARAVAEHAVPRTVFLSSVGAEKRHGVGEIDGLARTEELLDATGNSVLHLRCGYFFSNLLMDLDALRGDGVLRVPWPLDHAMPWVDPRDIGEVAAARLLSREWSGRRVQAVHGPEDLTFTQVATVLGAVLGRPVHAERISDDTLRAALRQAGLGDRQVEGLVGMAAGQREDFRPEDERTVLTTTPTTLAAWAQQWIRPLM